MLFVNGELGLGEAFAGVSSRLKCVDARKSIQCCRSYEKKNRAAFAIGTRVSKRTEVPPSFKLRTIAEIEAQQFLMCTA